MMKCEDDGEVDDSDLIGTTYDVGVEVSACEALDLNVAEDGLGDAPAECCREKTG